MTPSSDNGKIAVALYSILSIPVIASLLVPARDILESMCMVRTRLKPSKKVEAVRTKAKLKARSKVPQSKKLS